MAQRGQVRLTVADVRDALQRIDPAARAQLVSNPVALATFVRERLLQADLAAQARARGVDRQPDVMRSMREASEAVLVQSYLAAQTPLEPGFPSDADIAAAYEANKQRFMLPKQYKLEQIFVALPPGASHDADEDARRRAADLRAQAVKPKADFTQIANKSPQGIIGWVREDQLVPGVKEAVAGLGSGAISDPVRSPSGWHVIKLLDTRLPAPAPPADVRDQLVTALRQARQQQAIRTYLDAMLKTDPVQINEIDLARAANTH